MDQSNRKRPLLFCGGGKGAVDVLLSRAIRRTSLAVVLVTAGSGCGGTPTEPTADGRVQVAGTIRDFQSNAALAGARVSIGSVTATTDSGGRYSLSVEAGAQRVFVDDESVALITPADRIYRGDFFGRLTGCVARYGTIIDRQTRRPVSGAAVSAGGVTVATDQTGWFQMSLGCPGSPCVGMNTTFLTITHPNYTNASFPAGRGICLVSRVDYELDRR
jgi:hypothetical protein